MTGRAAGGQDWAFEAWLDAQWQHSARGMLASVSPVAVVMRRPGFGQTVRPVAGAIVASPVPGAYDPDPDYFFHWFRDSAVVVDALRLLQLDGWPGDEALRHLRDFTRFSLALTRLDGRVVAALPGRRARVAPDFLQYLRDDDDLAAAHGDAVAAETRVNADGTLDGSRWARPQHDGPPLRALALLRWLRDVPLEAGLMAQVASLLRIDLGFTLRHWRVPSYDIWEEESGQHYYTLRVSAAALAEGADWLGATGDADLAQRCRDAARAVFARLDGYRVDAPDGSGSHYRSRGAPGEPPGAKALDIAVILSAIHARGDAGAHGVGDPCMQATLARLDALFAAAYAINHDRRPGHGTAMGRYDGDVYYSGGAYYFSTLGAAEFCFRAAALGRDAPQWLERGDAYLATVRAHTPAGGALSEQFDRSTGEQTSARQLAWSHAAFLSCVAARRDALAERARPGAP